MKMDPKELDLFVPGASTHHWVGQAGNADCCRGMKHVQMMVDTGKLTKEEGKILFEELQRQITEGEKKVQKAGQSLDLLDVTEEPKQRPELVPPLISLFFRVYLDAKKRGEEETARKIIEGLDFLGILDRPK
jgi:hypothetical protein